MCIRDSHRRAEFDLEVKDTILSRYVNPAPFVPADKTDRDRRCDEILMIQAMGLKKRLEHTNCKTAVIGISGGLDSTLAPVSYTHLDVYKRQEHLLKRYNYIL